MFYGQNTSYKHVNSENISVVEINLPLASSIDISNNNSDYIDIEYSTRGEYKNYSFLYSKTEENRFFIKEKLMSSITNLNNKLSIHKNYSTIVKISIPKKINLRLNIKNALTSISGKLNMITISQQRGTIFLNEWNSPGSIKTISAEIIFKNSNIKVLSNIDMQAPCANSNSEQIIYIESLKGKINCITY